MNEANRTIKAKRRYGQRTKAAVVSACVAQADQLGAAADRVYLDIQYNLDKLTALRARRIGNALGLSMAETMRQCVELNAAIMSGDAQQVANCSIARAAYGSIARKARPHANRRQRAKTQFDKWAEAESGPKTRQIIIKTSLKTAAIIKRRRDMNKADYESGLLINNKTATYSAALRQIVGATEHFIAGFLLWVESLERREPTKTPRRQRCRAMTEAKRHLFGSRKERPKRPTIQTD